MTGDLRFPMTAMGGYCEKCGAPKAIYLLNGGGEMWACLRCPFQDQRTISAASNAALSSRVSDDP